MNRRTELAQPSVPPRASATTTREPSGVHRRTSLPDPEVFFVRAHRRGGYCVMIDGKPSPISAHYTMWDAIVLAEMLAKKANARVVVEE